MTRNNVLITVVLFTLLIVFEVVLWISIESRFTHIEYKMESVNIEIEELRKTQRLISQDAELALRLVVESEEGNSNEQ